MNPQIALLLAQDGVTTGAIYVLLATALVMVFTVTRIIYVPQGEFVAFAALTLAAFESGKTPGTIWILLGGGVTAFAMELYALRAGLQSGTLRRIGTAALLYLLLPAALALLAAFGVDATAPLAWKIVVTVALIVALGPMVYRIAFEPIADASPLTLLIAAIALHFVLTGLGLFCFGAEGVRTSPFADGAIHIGVASITPQSLWVTGLSAAIILGLYGFFGHTLYGKALKATAVNRNGAQLVGISPALAGRLTLTIAAFIGAISGVLIGPLTTLYYDSGFLLGLKGFVGAIIGGLALYPVAALGAVLVGLLEAFSSFWASTWKEVIVFTLIVPVLLWRSLAHPQVDDEEP